MNESLQFPFKVEMRSPFSRYFFDEINSFPEEVSLQKPISKLNNLLGMNKLLFLWKQLLQIIIADFLRCLTFTLYPRTVTICSVSGNLQNSKTKMNLIFPVSNHYIE